MENVPQKNTQTPSSPSGITLPKIFDKNPELKKRMEAYLANVSDEKKEEDYKKFEKFVSGELTWAEIKNYPRTFLKELAEIAYLKYRSGDYVISESLFKGLSIIDHTNWYYRAALGTIYQKQDLLEQAIDEYSTALMFEENEISCLVNRGECYLRLSQNEEAKADFEKAVALDSQQKNPWGKRAFVLLKKIKEQE